MTEIDGKVVAITGASRGIGEAIALRLAGRGAKLVLGARGEDGLAELAGRIEAAGGEVAFLPTDVRRREDVEKLVGLAVERFGRLDVLVSNAGVMPVSLLDDLRVEDWDAMVDVNLKGVMYGAAAALPVFRRQGFGHFVNTASTAGHLVKPSMAVYAATKFAVRAFSEGLRQEAGDSVRVTIVSPGMTRTDFTTSMTSPETIAQYSEVRDRLAMSPDAVARAIAYAIEQPSEVDVNEIVLRPTAQV
jgi:NADP-dependent 3-hydroxy acid dehydrogenase YdfG